MSCKTHPRYRAKRKPTADCQTCRMIWRRSQKQRSEPFVPLFYRGVERPRDCYLIAWDGSNAQNYFDLELDNQTRRPRCE